MPSFKGNATGLRQALKAKGQEAQIVPQFPDPPKLAELSPEQKQRYAWSEQDRQGTQKFAADLLEFLRRDRVELGTPLTRLAQQASSLDGRITETSEELTVEVAQRAAGDAVLTQSIADEVAARAAAITTEENARIAGDSALQSGKQDASAQLSALAALVVAAGQIIVGSGGSAFTVKGAGVAVTITPVAFGPLDLTGGDTVDQAALEARIAALEGVVVTLRDEVELLRQSAY